MKTRCECLECHTWSKVVCSQGKEKVKATGCFFSILILFSCMKSFKDSETWSNNYKQKIIERRQKTLLIIFKHQTFCQQIKPDLFLHLRSFPNEQLLWNRVCLLLHLHSTPPNPYALSHFNLEHLKLWSSNIQCQKLSFLCTSKKNDKENLAVFRTSVALHCSFCTCFNQT